MNEILKNFSVDETPGPLVVSIGMVVAASTNNVIGKDNQLIWRLPNDLKFFKNTTWGFPVIMGRKSYESLNKPLAGRTNIVVTRKEDWHAAGVITAPDIKTAIEKATASNAKNIFIIGGGEIYRQSMEIADAIYITRVHAIVEGDTLFPEIDKAKWQLISNEDFPVDEKHAYAYSFQLWKKYQK
ncbi:MAG: dihydrofolate reductase [Ferruginibacter sp.]